MNLKTLVFGPLLACSALLGLPSAQAQNFPNKPLTLMVPYPAGGLSDVLARTINQPLAKSLHQPVIVENLGGVSGAMAAQKVLATAADGHHLFQGSPNELILSPLVNAAVKFKSEDFRMVQMIGAAQIAVYARANLPVRTVDELLDLARKQAGQGQPLTYATVGQGSLYHLLGEHLSHLTGIPLSHVPYKGGAPAYQDLIGGQVDLMISVYSKNQQQLADSGKIKILALLNSERLDGVKQIPVMAENKQLKNFSFNIWTGYFVKKDTPEAMVQVLHKALTETLGDAGVRDNLHANSMLVAKPQGLPEAGKAYAESVAQFRAMAKSIQVQAQ